MFGIKISLFAGAKTLETKIDSFHDNVIDAAMTFNKSIATYLQEGRSEDFKKTNKQLRQIEHDADQLRRDIENRLYVQNLIPDLRADVLELVENLDKVINRFDEVSYQFYIERPEIPEIYNTRIMTLVTQVTECAENLSIASRSFFRNFSLVRDYSQKVYFLEHESDLSSGHLKESIFDSDMPLANKLQLSTLFDEIENIADLAEDCVDELLIFTIKRDI